MKWKCTWFALVLQPLFTANLQKICMKLEGRQVATPLNMDPTCTDPTWSKSSRFCRKSCFSELCSHTCRIPPKSRWCQSSVLLLHVTLVDLLWCLISVNFNELHVLTAVPASASVYSGRKLGTRSCFKRELVISECHKGVLGSGINPCRHNEFKDALHLETIQSLRCQSGGSHVYLRCLSVRMSQKSTGLVIQQGLRNRDPSRIQRRMFVPRVLQRTAWKPLRAQVFSRSQCE